MNFDQLPPAALDFVAEELEAEIRSQARQDALYAYPKEKSIRRFMDQVRQRTKRTTPLRTEELIAGLNPLLRGWGEYYKRAHVRKLFQRLDGWIRRRIWSHRYRRWRNAGWKRLPATQLYDEYELVRLIYLIPSLASWRRSVFVKAAYGKTVRAVWAADGGQRFTRASSDSTIAGIGVCQNNFRFAR